MKTCKRRRARWDSGPRPPGWVRHVVIHSTEGGTAASVAADFATRPRERGASTQLVIDDKECYRCVPDLVIPWGAPGVNRSGLHIEHCGFAAWLRGEWLLHSPMLHDSAEKAALWCWLYHIPRRWLTVNELRAGKAGFCRHVDASRAFIGSGHTDPGAGFPGEAYLRLVKQFYKQIVEERTR